MPKKKEINKSLKYRLERFITLLILMNITMIVLESFDDWYDDYHMYFNAFDVFSVMVFSVEYLVRLRMAWVKGAKGKKIKSLFKFVISPLGLVDFLAILPFYLPLIIHADLRFLRTLRLFRLLRIFKLKRYSKSFNLVLEVFKDKKEDLGVTMFVTLIMLLFSSILMYYVEHDAQPKAFPNIPESLWWAVATLTTVGYGDVYPITPFGKLMSGIIALLGIGIVALPTGILSSAFVDKMRKDELRELEDEDNAAPKKIKYCPHCGEKLGEHVHD
ncbi:ion transporter [Flammeovirgaceae bacterium SG7u.111]|nr:ion transporter [Flammeovirgaceae bacterium SG7u.132]WPO33118.1 ion transporter [Flammeovirgaceae bacterium SG7u.111]